MRRIFSALIENSVISFHGWFRLKQNRTVIRMENRASRAAQNLEEGDMLGDLLFAHASFPPRKKCKRHIYPAFAVVGVARKISSNRFLVWELAKGGAGNVRTFKVKVTLVITVGNASRLDGCE